MIYPLLRLGGLGLHLMIEYSKSSSVNHRARERRAGINEVYDGNDDSRIIRSGSWFSLFSAHVHQGRAWGKIPTNSLKHDFANACHVTLLLQF